MKTILSTILLVTPCIAFAEPSMDGNQATPPSRIKIADGFQIELLHSVPAAEQGSWVALCTDDKGRFYASDSSAS